MFHSKIFSKYHIVPIKDVVFAKANGCPNMTWSADEHGLCEVDLFLSFVQKDNYTKNITVPVSDESFQDCNFTMEAVKVLYKTSVFFPIGMSGYRLPTSYKENPLRTASLIMTSKTTTTAEITKSKKFH